MWDRGSYRLSVLERFASAGEMWVSFEIALMECSLYLTSFETVLCCVFVSVQALHMTSLVEKLLLIGKVLHDVKYDRTPEFSKVVREIHRVIQESYMTST